MHARARAPRRDTMERASLEKLEAMRALDHYAQIQLESGRLANTYYNIKIIKIIYIKLRQTIFPTRVYF